MCLNIFVNLSNHSITDWSETQRGAARVLAPELMDLQFPYVDPEMALGDLETRVEELIQYELPEGVTHAMVQGEFTMTVLLVKALQNKGIQCYAATTMRISHDEGAGLKRSAFRFVQFREYPGNPN
jgi:hypothetical protein